MEPGQPPPLPTFAPPPIPGAPTSAAQSNPGAPDVPPSYLPYATREFVPGPPRVWTPFVAYFVALVGGFAVAMTIAVTIALAIYGQDATDDFESLVMEPEILLPTVVGMQLVLAAVAMTGAALSPVPWRRRLRLLKPRLPWYGYPVLAAGTYALGWASAIVIEMLGFGDVGALEDFSQAIVGLDGWLLVTTAAVVGLAPGFGEELLFRGYIQTRLVRRWPRLLAVAVTSVLFGVIHMDLVQGTFAIFLGLWLGEVADRTGSIWPAIVCHVFNNAVATIMAGVFGSEAQAVEGVSGAGDYWVGLGLVGAAFLAAWVYLRRRPVVPTEKAPAPVPVLTQPASSVPA